MRGIESHAHLCVKRNLPGLLALLSELALGEKSFSRWTQGG
jgi:hypothetical protein